MNCGLITKRKVIALIDIHTIDNFLAWERFPIYEFNLGAAPTLHFPPQLRSTLVQKSTSQIPKMLSFHLLSLHCHHASCCHDVRNWWTQRSDRFGVDAAETMAQKPADMVGGRMFARLFT